MGKEFDLLSYGEVLLRLSPEGHERLDDSETFTKRVGGAELNVATGVAMLGLRTGIISKLPSNPLGTFAKNRIRFSVSAASVMIILFMMTARKHDLDFIIMKSDVIRESRVLCMTEQTLLSVTATFPIIPKACMLPQSFSM